MSRLQRLRDNSGPLILLVGLSFSYMPLVSFGRLSGLHLDISLLYLVVLAYIVISLGYIYAQRATLWRSLPLRLLLVFTLYQTLSIAWSANLPRAIVTAGFMWLLVGLAVTIMAHMPSLLGRKQQLEHWLILTSLVMIAMSLWQVIGDALGVPAYLTLLPADYQSSLFGVARPVGFAAEPQFLGSLLLFPLLLMSWRVMQAKTVSWRPGLLLALVAMTLVLTISRGAAVAALLGLIVLLVTVRPSFRQLRQLAIFGSIGGVIAVVVICGAATINQRDTISGSESVAKIVNQFSLGTIDLTPAEPSSPSPRSASQPAKPPTSDHDSDGYVAASTKSRLSMTDAALSLWLRTPSTVLFGVGSGGFGARLHATSPQQATGSVVNNYYVELLVELGLVGAILFAGFIISLLIALYRHRAWLLLASVSAFLLQWCFFSGNANVIHVWVVLAIAMALSSASRHPAERRARPS